MKGSEVKTLIGKKEKEKGRFTEIETQERRRKRRGSQTNGKANTIV